MSEEKTKSCDQQIDGDWYVCKDERVLIHYCIEEDGERGPFHTTDRKCRGCKKVAPSWIQDVVLLSE